jgi:hypothetical protein
MKSLSLLFILSTGLAIAMPPVLAQDTSAKPAKKKEASERKASNKRKADTGNKQALVDEGDKEPDISASLSTEFNCELGNRLTIYRNEADNQHIAMRWNTKLLRMTRVATTTGANRFENSKNGLVWIDIPTKGMLLDSKKGRQLANECMSPEQLRNKPEEIVKS